MKIPKYKESELNYRYILRKKDDKKEYIKFTGSVFIYTNDLTNATLFSFVNALEITDKRDDLEKIKLIHLVSELRVIEFKNKPLIK